MVFSAILTHVELERAKKAFDAFDKDSSGRVNIWELREILEGLYHTPPLTQLSASHPQMKS